MIHLVNKSMLLSSKRFGGTEVSKVVLLAIGSIILPLRVLIYPPIKIVPFIAVKLVDPAVSQSIFELSSI